MQIGVCPEWTLTPFTKLVYLNSKKLILPKTHEEAISLQNGMQSIGMISRIAISQHLQSKYRLMHIGLVQVAVKPLLRTGVNAPIYLALRDKRLRHYKSSLLAMIQTNVCKNPLVDISLRLMICANHKSFMS